MEGCWFNEHHTYCSVDPDMKSLVYGVGIAEGGEDDWDFVWQKYHQSNDAYEKRLYLRALGRTKQLWLLNRSEGTKPNTLLSIQVN